MSEDDYLSGVTKELVHDLTNENQQIQLDAAQRITKLLSRDQNPPINEVIQSGIIPQLVQLLENNSFPMLQFESAWALTNIASGNSNQTRVVVEAGAVPAFIRLLKSPNDDVVEQSVWALGNIAGDSPQCRDFVLSQDVLPPLLRFVTAFT